MLSALLTALDSKAFYVGALGSRRNQERRRERLLEAGVDESALERISGPAEDFCLLVTQRVWSPDPWERLSRAAQLADTVGAPTVVVHPPFSWQRDYATDFVDGVALREHIDGLDKAATPPERIRQFLRGPEAHGVFEQEAKKFTDAGATVEVK